MKTDSVEKSEIKASPVEPCAAWPRRTALVCLIGFVALTFWGALAGPRDVGGKKEVKIYTANGYVGALIEAPLVLDPSDPNYVLNLLLSVTQVYTQIVASDPPARMAALAEEIAAQRPDLAGLEELYTIRVAADVAGQPGDFAVVYDYLGLLTNALAARGAHYDVAVLSTESDIAMPLIESLDPVQLAWGRITDHEAILVRSDLPPGHLQISNPQTGRFAEYLRVPVGDQIIAIYRGWCSVDVFTRGERFRVICAHPHDESAPEIQREEVIELVSEVANVAMPVLLIGDMNSDPFNRNGTDSYALFPGAGFQDSWVTLHPDDLEGGLTWGHDPALSDPTEPFVYRLDYIFYRGEEFTPTSVEVLDPRINATHPPLWPSDHKAVTATFSLGKAKWLMPHRALAR